MTTTQFGRKASLVVTAGQKGLDLSQLRFTFKTSQSERQSPGFVNIRVYNLSDQTSISVQNEYNRVILQAGYDQGNFGVIFDGTIKQVRRGRESPTDTFLDIFAADGDIPYNFAVVNTTLPAGSVPQDEMNALVSSVSGDGVNVSYAPSVALGPSRLRGKTLFGMARDSLRDFADNQKWTYSIQNGGLVFVPITGYVPGDAVVLTAKTGMIGMPEQTEDGIHVTCLLNPLLSIGRRIQIDNKSVIPAQIATQFTSFNRLARIAEDGMYRAMVIEHEGDTRGTGWYSKLTCLSVDTTLAPGISVKGFG